ncbi:NAD(P)H-dependent oxidoreductase [Breoghania sp. L-A4]|uniref:NAD(P)H-dependent oxidoreductase n=1 Tax=Breoghania sp. L-A4 TaxID=2304600 RepID=UPI000E358508|nr:NAD(P)H-dependent oxidoreductase [Breoghania sp. L-A4]AXS41842.1 flavodoxin family protein [Breoghania sp. L-A4]
MSRNIVLIQGHPDPDPARLCRALADAYAQGARDAGHTVTLIDIAALDFPLLRSPEDYYKGPTPPGLEDAAEAILAADHLVLVFPLWLGTLPALTKGFFEQVLRHDTAFEQESGARWPHGKLSGISARIVVTMGMPAFIYRWWFLAHGLRGFERNILRFVGIKPVRETLFGMVDGVSDATRKGWLEKMRKLGDRAV